MVKLKEEWLAEYPVIIEFPIDWGDMDAFQHVNNVRYFRYFENVRIAYFEKSNMMQYMQKNQIGPILRDTQCRFRAPLVYPDTISVGAKITNVEEDRFTMKYAIFSDKLKLVVATGDSTVVFFDYQKHCKAAIPEEIKNFIKNIEKTTR